MPDISRERFVPDKGMSSLELGRLRQFLENNKDLPDDTTVLIERIEDVYFNKHNWKSVVFNFDYMSGSQRFFQPFSVSRSEEDYILIHAHY